MERRDLMKVVGAAAGSIAAATAVAGVSVPAASTAATAGNALVNIPPPDPEAYIPGRFAGKTFIVTGSARGMGAEAAMRLAREGANVVGVDW
jgi:hypothetical protein